MKTEQKGIQKYHWWLLFFFTIFGFTFAMIIWTIKSAVAVPVFEDESFLQNYQDVDANFNNMMIANHEFNETYDTKISINGAVLGLEVKDIFLGQRSLKTHSKNQAMLDQGKNPIVIKITDKLSGQVVEDAKIHLKITRAIQNTHDMEFKDISFKDGSYQISANIEALGNWNITGVIEVDDKKGYFFIKTNTKK